MNNLGEREAILKAQEIMDRRAGKIMPPCVNEAVSMLSENVSWSKCHEAISSAIMSNLASIATQAGLAIEHQDAHEVIASSSYGKIEVHNEGSLYKVRVMRNGKMISEDTADSIKSFEQVLRLVL